MKNSKNEIVHHFNNTMALRVIPDQSRSTIITLESNQSILHQDILLEEEIEKKAIQTIYAELKQVRL
jgi:hypothetical protein